MSELDRASDTEQTPPLRQLPTSIRAHEQASRYAFTGLPAGHGWNGVLSALLRQPGQIIYQLHESAGGWKVAAVLGGIALLCLLAYGVVVGAFSGGTQLWAAPLKIACGALLAAAICLPSLYVLVCLGGAHDKLKLGALAGLLLAAVAPQCDPSGQLRADSLGLFAVNGLGCLYKLSASGAVGHRILFWSAPGANWGEVFGSGRPGLCAGLAHHHDAGQHANDDHAATDRGKLRTVAADREEVLPESLAGIVCRAGPGPRRPVALKGVGRQPEFSLGNLQGHAYSMLVLELGQLLMRPR